MKKKVLGFNLIELLVAMALSVTLIMVVVESLSFTNGGVLFTNNYQELDEKLHRSLHLINQNLSYAGVFGSYSAHSTPSQFENLATSTPECATTEYCNFDLSSLGVKSQDNSGGVFSNFMTSLNTDGITLNSEVLRIQFGSKQSAYLNPYDHHGALCGEECTINQCTNSGASDYLKSFLNYAYFKNDGINTSSSQYVLSAANQAKLLNFSSDPFTSDAYLLAGESLIDFGLDSQGCPISGNLKVEFESSDAGTAPYYNRIGTDPDMYTLQLVNFNTNYYFVGTKNGVAGLYVKSLNENGSLEPAILIATQITNLTVDYKVDTLTYLNAYPSSTNTYRLVSTNNMSANDWLNISAVIVSLTGSSSQKVSFTGSNLSLTESTLVTW